MRFPNFVYVPSDYDVAKSVVLPSRVFQAASRVVAGDDAHFFTFGPVPTDRVLVLCGFSISATPTGGENVLELRVQASGVSSVANPIITQSGAAGGANVRITLAQHSTEIVLMGGEGLEFTAQYSAAVQAKTTDVAYWGVVLPRANFQLFTLPSTAG